MSKIHHYLIVALLGLSGLASQAANTSVGLTQSSPETATDFNAMYDASTQTPLLTMPEGWRIERQMTAPRTVGSYEGASTELMYAGDVNLASNAKNGTWN